jgi:hypothetical protein
LYPQPDVRFAELPLMRRDLHLVDGASDERMDQLRLIELSRRSGGDSTAAHQRGEKVGRVRGHSEALADADELQRWPDSATIRRVIHCGEAGDRVPI